MISFELLVQKNLDKLHGWLQLPHVRKYWDDGDRTIEQVHAHYLSENKKVK